MPRKKKELPDDFTDILESSDLDVMKAGYDACNRDATIGYRASTALALAETV